ncbi:hypothetical protein CNR22_20215 [Sphingobacteriaceae bacterium]|nr:hypothetical protein CNR22_20215 [Sphingobacteriaceae bacterium]
MRKVLLVAAVAMFAMTSCKKEYTCECTATVGQNGSTTSTTASTTIKDKKDDAKTTCENGSSDASSGGYTSKVVCVIK